MHDANYRPLKDFVARRGGMRLSMHGPLRDQIVEAIVADWPSDCPVERIEEVVKARLGIRMKRKYGSVIGFLLLSVLCNIIVRLVIDWWHERRSHRLLMEGWRQNAQAHP